MNIHLDTILIAPMTSMEIQLPTRVEFKIGGKRGWIALDHLMTIDKARVVQRVEVLGALQIDNVKRVIREMLVE